MTSNVSSGKRQGQGLDLTHKPNNDADDAEDDRREQHVEIGREQVTTALLVVLEAGTIGSLHDAAGSWHERPAGNLPSDWTEN